jgi:hypothetical protein
MVDALFQYLDGRTAALEIVADVDPVLAEHQVHIRNRQITAPSLKLRWALAPHPRFRTKKHLASWVQALRALESTGCSSMVDGPPQIVSHLRDAGVQSAFVIDGLGGCVELREAISGGLIESLTPDRPALFVEYMLNRHPDVVNKLRDHPDVDERHAFFWVTIGTDPMFQDALLAEEDAVASCRDPTLPAGVTHVWMAGQSTAMRTALWSPDRKWSWSCWQLLPH